MPGRICFLDQTGELGGAEICLADLAESVRDRAVVVLFQDGRFARTLRDRGLEVEVVALPGLVAGVGKVAGLAAYVWAALGMAPFLWRVSRIVRGYDLLYANTMKALVVAALLGLVLRKPFCFHLHDVLSGSHFSRLNRGLVLALTRRAALVIANSRASAEAYRKAGGKNRCLRVLYNGFRLEHFVPVSAEAAQAALPASARGKRPLVGLFGRVTPWKGQHVLIEALVTLPGVHGLIVGEALFTDEDRRYRQELEILAERLGVKDRVHFAGFCSDVRPLYCAVDAVVHCSVAPEPFGRVVVEAMLLGRPVVAAGAGGVLEVVDAGRTGLLVPPADPPALAAALRLLCDNPECARALGQAARDAVRARFGLSQILCRWNAWISEVLAGPYPKHDKEGGACA